MVLQKKKTEIYPKLEKRCVELKKALIDLANSNGVHAQVYNIASMYQIFFTDKPIVDYENAKCSDSHLFSVYFHELLKEGVFIPPSQFETCFLSTAHVEEDLKWQRRKQVK